MELTNTFVFCPIIPTFIEKALTTLYTFTPPNFRVILIDQTFDGMKQYVGDERVHLYLRPYRNLGFAQSMNTGIRLSTTPYVTVANDDIEFINSRWWEGIEETFAQDPNIKAVNPQSVTEPGWGYGCNRNSDPELIAQKEVELKARFNLDTQHFEHLPYKEKYTEADYDFLRAKKAGLCDGIITWMTVFDRQALELKGVFDERFCPGGGEDYDINGRFYSTHWPNEDSPRYRMVATSRSWVWHHLSSSRSFKGQILPTLRPGFGDDHAMWQDKWPHPTMAKYRIGQVERYSL